MESGGKREKKPTSEIARETLKLERKLAKQSERVVVAHGHTEAAAAAA